MRSRSESALSLRVLGRVVLVSLVALSAAVPAQASIPTDGAVEVASPTGVRLRQTVQADRGRYEFIAEARGTASSVGKPLRATITDVHGATASSAPVHLAPYWQRFGVTLPTQGGTLTLSVIEDSGTWARGHDYEVRIVSAQQASITQVTTQGRQMLVDGVPVRMKGYNLGNGPIGTAVGASGANLLLWQMNPAQCQSDADLMAKADVNSLRISFLDVYDERALQCMDAFHANGIGLLWLVNGPGAVQFGASPSGVNAGDLGSVPLPDPVREIGDEAVLEAFWATLSNVIEQVKDHPATWGYVIGNENNRQDTATTASWHANLNELARRTKELDPNHVTTTSLSGSQFNRINPGTAPNVDMWGTNQKGTASGYPSSLWTSMATKTTRPIWMSEFGTDRYHCLSHPAGFGLQILLDDIGCSVPGSFEDTATQAAWLAAQWDDIADNLSADDPDNVLVGGSIFMWSDWWAFACCLFNGWGTEWTHDLSNHPQLRNSPSSAQKGNIEWIGHTHALRIHQPGPRVTLPVYDVIAERFTGTAGPSITTPAVSSVGPCGATLSWQTDVPTSYRIDFGLEQKVTVDDDSGEPRSLIQDNFVADWSRVGSTTDTQWTVRLQGLQRGVEYRAYVRAFDANGRIGSADPVTFTTPLNGPGAECGLVLPDVSHPRP